MKVLLVTRHFPPEISGGGRRPFLIHRGLTRLGVDVDVLAPRLPDGVSGLEVPVGNSSQTQSGPARPGLLDPLRYWARWPDPEIVWAKRALARLDAQGRSYDWVVTTSPPSRRARRWSRSATPMTGNGRARRPRS